MGLRVLNKEEVFGLGMPAASDMAKWDLALLCEEPIISKQILQASENDIIGNLKITIRCSNFASSLEITPKKKLTGQAIPFQASKIAMENLGKSKKTLTAQSTLTTESHLIIQFTSKTNSHAVLIAIPLSHS